MRNVYFLLFGALLLSSCSAHLITRGITDKNDNYVLTSGGKKVASKSITVNDNSVSTDSVTIAMNNISGIKTGSAYFGVANSKLYDGVYFGKLILLRRYAGYSYNTRTGASTPNYSYYLQKEGEPEIVDFTGKNLVDAVRDNPKARHKAQSARIFSTITIVSAATTIAGLSCVFLPYGNKLRTPAVTIGLYSMPTFLISLPIASHKKYKAIVVYDR